MQQGTVNFSGVLLTDSIVLGWNLAGDLEISLEVALDQSHTLYEKPRHGHRACFKPGILRFPNAASVQGLLAQGEVASSGTATDPDFDTIHVLELRPTGYYLEGEFGEVTFKSSPPVLQFETGRTQQIAAADPYSSLRAERVS